MEALNSIFDSMDIQDACERLDDAVSRAMRKTHSFERLFAEVDIEDVFISFLAEDDQVQVIIHVDSDPGVDLSEDDVEQICDECSEVLHEKYEAFFSAEHLDLIKKIAGESFMALMNYNVKHNDVMYLN